MKSKNQLKMGEQKKECCATCPYARATPKEYLDTRGDNGDRFAGQASGSFALPCHMEEEFEDWRTRPAPQCAGAAKYRANTGVSVHPSLGIMPEDHEAVFSSPAELLAHHRGTSIEEAEESLENHPVSQMLQEESIAAFIKARVSHRRRG